MAGYTSLVDLRALTGAAALLVLAASAHADYPELNGASPGEREAIVAYCSDSRGSVARSMCMSNQMTNVVSVGRKPDLSVASAKQRSDIVSACAPRAVPADLFGCERDALTANGLPVRNEAGGGPVDVSAPTRLSPLASPLSPRNPNQTEFPYFSIEDWRAMRPPMPTARTEARLTPSTIYEETSPSVYIVIASEHPIELAERTPHSQGSAVAITDHILVTNCHVLAGRLQIRISQRGQSDRATLLYADPGGDRCFLKSQNLLLRPVRGVRKFNDLRVGEAVFSVGTPIGLEQSFGQGIISGLRQYEGVNVVQNSAPSWHGSSGGGLFDASANLVGITTAISTNIPNLNFAISAQDFWF